VLSEPAGVETLDRIDDSRVEIAPALAEEACVRHLVGQRVLEGVLRLGEQGRLVQELGSAQPGERSAECGLRGISDRL
jgi:hypothetical protein